MRHLRRDRGGIHVRGYGREFPHHGRIVLRRPLHFVRRGADSSAARRRRAAPVLSPSVLSHRRFRSGVLQAENTARTDCQARGRAPIQVLGQAARRGMRCGFFPSARHRMAGSLAEGIEFSHDAVVFGRREGAGSLTEGDFLEARYGESSFDIVTLWHVLEHLPRSRRNAEKDQGTPCAGRNPRHCRAQLQQHPGRRLPGAMVSP